MIQVEDLFVAKGEEVSILYTKSLIANGILWNLKFKIRKSICIGNIMCCVWTTGSINHYKANPWEFYIFDLI